MLRRLLAAQQAGLLLVILVLAAALTLFAGSHVDPASGRTVKTSSTRTL